MLRPGGIVLNAFQSPLAMCTKIVNSSQSLVLRRNWINNIRWASSSTRKYRIRHGFTTPIPLYRSPLASRYPIICQRSLSTIPITRRKLFHRVGQVGKLVLVIAAGGAALAVLYTGAEVWTTFHPPQLSLWPEELREDLSIAWAAKKVDEPDAAVELLTKVWETIQGLPMDFLSPNPSIKFLSTAICLADALQETNQELKAYRVLTDAVTLYHARFPKSVSSPADVKDQQTPSTAPGNATERRCLVYVFLKLASLSERYDPAAEGKWLSSAVRETVGLLPLYRDIPTERFATTISSIQELSEFDASFSQLSNQDDARSPSASFINDDNPSSCTETTITVDDLNDNGTGIPLPTWMVPDIDTAMILVFEQIGLYAEKHDRLELALSTFNLASDSLVASAPDIDATDSKFTAQHWEVLSQVHRVLNRQTSIHLRLLESDITPFDWFSRFNEATKAQTAAQTLLKTLEKGKDLNKDEWFQMSSFLKPLQHHMREMVVTYINKAEWLEKAGATKSARPLFTSCLEIARKMEYKVEEEKCQACLERIERPGSQERRTLLTVLVALQKENEELCQQTRVTTTESQGE